MPMPKFSQNSLEQYLDTSMSVGQNRRFYDCPFCGERVRGRGFVVTRTKRGFFLWCFKCHNHRHLTSDGTSLGGIRRYLKSRETSRKTAEDIVIRHNVVTLPRDFTTEIPAAGLVWLRKAGVTDDEIARHRIGYSPELHRVILPVWGDEGLLYWQGRALEPNDNTPKYINVGMKRAGTFFTCDVGSDTTAIVEDILSALAVARAGANSLALLGSSMEPGVQQAIKSRKVRVWLDPDKRKECIRYAKMLSAYGLQASPVVMTTRDPKEYSVEEIQKILSIQRRSL